MSETEDQQESPAVTNFRRYLRIPSVHPDINYDECVEFISEMANEMSLPVNVIYVNVDKPVVIVTMEGAEPSLPSILLNSHMDVVPVFPEHWTHPPFGAEKDSNGNIYARGAQDMKAVAIQYIEAIRKYVNEGLKLKRTVHLCFVPDEEIGGEQGMGKFVTTEEFRQLNVGFALDEGGSSPTEEFTLDYAQRSEWEFTVICSGNGGHGSIMHDETAAEKLHYVLGKFLEFRAQQKQKLLENPCLRGHLTSVNVTVLSGGVLGNVVPAELEATFDVRVGVEIDHIKLEAMFRKWCSEAGPGIQLQFKHKSPPWGVTKLDSSNPWWMAFKAECDKMGLKVRPQICPAGTDSRFLRQVGIPALGFAPMNNTPFLFHSHDEYLNEKVFLRGIDIYYNIIKSLASL